MQQGILVYNIHAEAKGSAVLRPLLPQPPPAFPRTVRYGMAISGKSQVTVSSECLHTLPRRGTWKYFNLKVLKEAPYK